MATCLWYSVCLMRSMRQSANRDRDPWDAVADFITSMETARSGVPKQPLSSRTEWVTVITSERAVPTPGRRLRP